MRFGTSRLTEALTSDVIRLPFEPERVDGIRFPHLLRHPADKAFLLEQKLDRRMEQGFHPEGLPQKKGFQGVGMFVGTGEAARRVVLQDHRLPASGAGDQDVLALF